MMVFLRIYVVTGAENSHIPRVGSQNTMGKSKARVISQVEDSQSFFVKIDPMERDFFIIFVTILTTL